MDVILNNTPVGIGLFRDDGRRGLTVVYLNPAAIADSGQILGQNLYEALPYHNVVLPELGRSLRDLYSNILQTGQGQDIQFYFPSKEVTGWFETRVRRPKPGLILCVWRNITELMEGKIRDPLTGLYNRTYLKHRTFEPACLMFLDMDGFKRVNDTLGHDAGDQLLKDIANRLRRTIPKEHTIVRMGGDEFAVLLRTADEQTVWSLALSVIESLKKPFLLANHTVLLTTACGLVACNTRFSQAMRNVDLAMYASKREGRRSAHETGGTPMWYTAAMGAEYEDDQAILDLLKRRIAAREVYLDYQPIVSLQEPENPTCAADFPIVGYEALARMNDHKGKPVSPGRFVGVAEKHGLITSLTLLTLEIACEQCKALNALPNLPRPLKISVNLSGQDINNPRLLTGIESILNRAGIQPRLISFEITESVIPNPIAAKQVIQQIYDNLGDTGLDDLATGGGTLELMFILPLKFLKIDQLFVRNELQSVAPMIAMGHSKGLAVICEGIETLEAALVLRENRAEMGQGYFFSRPMSAEVMMDFWRT